MTEVISTPSEDKLLRLEEALPKLRPALEQKELGNALEQALSVLRPFDGQRRQLESLTDAAALLLNYLELSRRDLEEIADEIEELAGEMEEANSQYELNGIAKSFPNLSQKHIPRYNRAVVAMLSRYATKELSGLGTLGRLLIKIGADEVGEKLQALEREAKRLEQTSPSALADGIREIQAQKDATQAELTALAKDPQVDAFLMALSRGQTSLALVTPEVLDWLDSLNARDQFKVMSA